MPRDIPVGNGRILIAFDKNYLLREFYFPHVGQENHVGKEPFRLGVWVDGRFSWIPEGWKIQKRYLDDSLVTDVELVHDEFRLRIIANDVVDFHENIYLKKLTVENLSVDDREIRIFLCNNFQIYGNNIGDTAAYRPEVNGLLHYKGDRYFLINVFANKKAGIDWFATGNNDVNSFKGTWRDAEDGVLSDNPIAQGSVDSVIGIHLKLAPRQKDICYYWISAGKNWSEVSRLNAVILKKSPESILKRSMDYWNLWVNKEDLDDEFLPDNLRQLYKKSLLIIRTQTDNCGSIMAANDSDVVDFNSDTYSYMWPRDAALVAYAFDLAGYHEVTRRFFTLCSKIIEKEGYFLHKYTPSGSLASSWHPWLKDRRPQLPIQEDETALVIWALWQHFVMYKDIEFIKPLYKSLIKRAADFMMNYRDTKTRLPLPSYDLWEERQGILTFTVSTVYGGLIAAAHFAEAFGETSLAGEYREGANQIRDAMDTYLYLDDKKRFARMINFNKTGDIEIDDTVDASLYGIFAFGAYRADNDRVRNTMGQVHETLWCKTDVGGIARNEDDYYYRVSQEVPGNPWFVTTLWLAQYYIASAREMSDLDKAMNIMKWVAERALPSGVLAEQVNPLTNEPLSVSPLTWSHATYIIAIQELIKKHKEINT